MLQKTGRGKCAFLISSLVRSFVRCIVYMLSILQHVYHIDDVAYGCSVKLIGVHIDDSMCVGKY